MNRGLLAKCLIFFALFASPVYADDAKCAQKDRAFFELDKVPPQATLHEMDVSPAEINGRKAIRAEPVGADDKPSPSLLIIPACFRNGTLSVDVLARLNNKKPEGSRAFAGIIYRLQKDGRFESVYLRALNGRKANPPSPRDNRAVQYFAYPDWGFDKLRAAYPDGKFESGANIGPDEWVNLTVNIDESKVSIFVNNEKVMDLARTVVDPSTGSVGLYVGFGTEAYFSNLRVVPQAPQP
jgi:hypothetical protein